MVNVNNTIPSCGAYKRSVEQTLLNCLSDIDRVYGTGLRETYREYIRIERIKDPKFVSGRNCSSWLKHFKFITSGLLDGLADDTGYCHPLGRNIRLKACSTRRQERRRGHLSRKMVLCIASALVSAKKRLPNPCSCLTEDLERKTLNLLSTEDRTLPCDYKAHVVRELDRMFRKGKKVLGGSYEDYVRASVLSLGACRGVSRSKGGSKGLQLWSREEWKELHSSETSFEEYAYRGCERGPDEKPIVGYNLVIGGGKARGITMNEGNHQILKPLHKMLYDAISGERWLLRGEATANRFKGWNRMKEGDRVFVSGDYTSATDNLTIEVADLILSKMMTFLGTPDYIRKFARRSLRCDIEDSEGVVIPQARGQLMGSLLSFPLLCLQNYLAFRYYVPHDRVDDDHVRINGDDIVFKAERCVVDKWMDGVAALGLELSSGKTFVDGSFFALNSTYFWADKRGVRQLPVCRLGTLMRCSLADLGRSLNDFTRPFPIGSELLKDGLGLRGRALRTFFRFHKGLVKTYRGSWVREKPYGLEAKILSDELRRLGLLEQERYWFITSNAAIPTVDSINNFEVPKDYRLIRKRGKASKGGSSELFTEWHWATSIKLKNAKLVNISFENECFRVRSMPRVYEKCAAFAQSISNETWWDGDEEKSSDLEHYRPDGTLGGSRVSFCCNGEMGFERTTFMQKSDIGFGLLGRCDRNIARKLINTEHRLIDACITEVGSTRIVDSEKVTSLQRKKRFDYMFRGAFGGSDTLNFTFCNGSESLVGGAEINLIKLRELEQSYQDLYTVGTVEDDCVEPGLRYTS